MTNHFDGGGILWSRNVSLWPHFLVLVRHQRLSRLGSEWEVIGYKHCSIDFVVSDGVSSERSIPITVAFALWSIRRTASLGPEPRRAKRKRRCGLARRGER